MQGLKKHKISYCLILPKPKHSRQNLSMQNNKIFTCINHIQIKLVAALLFTFISGTLAEVYYVL